MPKDQTRFFGLGRATLRGVRKCPKCGTTNGTRGLCCKNKSCNVVFKEAGGRKKYSTESCRLETGTSTRVYSVRVRDKGPDYRGFVQLPMVPANASDSTLINESTALCFVEPCQRNFNASILQCHERNGETNNIACNHIRAALKCFSEALPLSLNTSILEALNISPEMKKEVWSLLTDSFGPVVQRVSKYTMAVKCKVSPKHPLGYLHFSFNFTSRGEAENQFSCPCSVFKENAKHRNREEQARCPHFYACLCAFVNNENLCEEFAQYIKLEIPLAQPGCETPEEIFNLGTAEQDDSELSNILNDSECRVQVFREEVNSILAENIGEDAIIFSTVNDIDHQSIESLKVTMDSEALSFPLDRTSLLEDMDSSKALSQMETEALISTQLELVPAMDLPSLDTPPYACGPDLTCQLAGLGGSKTVPLLLEPEVVISKKPARRPGRPGRSKPQGAALRCSAAAMTFKEWLGTVTESINQHMHYQFQGKPTPLVFHVPQKFFDKLKERIVAVRKKKVPSSITTFTRKDSIPMGTFTKYTWSLTNVMHVKYVFDTPYMPLQIIKAFFKNKDGTFVPTETIKERAGSAQSTLPLIRPAQYKTFIRVGMTSVDQVEPTPFKIEWIPDVLPLSHIGELRIQFEFGHLPNVKRSVDGTVV